MNFVKALQAFLKVLLGRGECPHSRVDLLKTPTYCQDCGYQVKVQWLLLHCRRCQVKRIPQRTLLGELKPIEQYCRHCGYEGYKIVKKDHIEAYELIFALSQKITLFEDASHRGVYSSNPFYTQSNVEDAEVFEAEVLRRQEFRGTRSAFKSDPYKWQTQQNPNRYGGKHKMLPYHD